MIILRGILAIVFLGLTFLIPFNYYTLVKFSVIELSAGWVFSTIYIRIVCIIFFIIGLKFMLSLFPKSSVMRFRYIFLIGLIPGFGISFITPIYNTDYGDLGDDLKLETVEVLSSYSEGAYDPGSKKHLVCFFSTDCGHCKNTAAKIGINQMAGQELEVHAFFANEQQDIEYFLENNNGSKFHAYQMGNAELFLGISGFELPSVFLVDENGKTLNHYKGDVVNYSTLDYLKDIEP